MVTKLDFKLKVKSPSVILKIRKQVWLFITRSLTAQGNTDHSCHSERAT